MPVETLPNIAKNSVGCRIAVQPATGIGKSDTGGRRLCIADKNVLIHHAVYPWLCSYRKVGTPAKTFFISATKRKSQPRSRLLTVLKIIGPNALPNLAL
jgi:hypothetical protein